MKRLLLTAASWTFSLPLAGAVGSVLQDSISIAAHLQTTWQTYGGAQSEERHEGLTHSAGHTVLFRREQETAALQQQQQLLPEEPAQGVDVTVTTNRDGQDVQTWDKVPLALNMMVSVHHPVKPYTIQSIPSFLDSATWFQSPFLYCYQKYFTEFTVTCREQCEVFFVEGRPWGTVYNLLDGATGDIVGWSLQGETMGCSNGWGPMKIYRKQFTRECTTQAPCVSTVSFPRSKCGPEAATASEPTWKFCRFFGGFAVKQAAEVASPTPHPTPAPPPWMTIITNRDGQDVQAWTREVPLALGALVLPDVPSRAYTITSVPSFLTGATWVQSPFLYCYQKYFNSFTVTCSEQCDVSFVEGLPWGNDYGLLEKAPEPHGWALQEETMGCSNGWGPMKVYRKQFTRACTYEDPCVSTIDFNHSFCSTDGGAAANKVWEQCRFWGGFAVKHGVIVSPTPRPTPAPPPPFTITTNRDGADVQTWERTVQLAQGVLVIPDVPQRAYTITSVPTFLDGATWIQSPQMYFWQKYFNQFNVICRVPCELFFVEGLSWGKSYKLMDGAPKRDGWTLQQEAMGCSNGWGPMKVYKKEFARACSASEPCTSTVSFNRSTCSTDGGAVANKVWEQCCFFGGFAFRRVEVDDLPEPLVVTSLQDGSNMRTWSSEPLTVGMPAVSTSVLPTSAHISTIPPFLVGATWYGMAEDYSSQTYFTRFTITCYHPCEAFFLEGRVAGTENHLLDKSSDRAGWVLQDTGVAVNSSLSGPLKVYRKIPGVECTTVAPCNVTVNFGSENCTTHAASCRFFGGFAVKPYEATVPFPLGTVNAGGEAWQAIPLGNASKASVDGERVVQSVPKRFADVSELYRAQTKLPQVTSISVTTNRSARVLLLMPLEAPQNMSIVHSGGRSCQDASVLASTNGNWHELEETTIVMNEAGVQHLYGVQWTDMPGRCTAAEPCTTTLSFSSAVGFSGAIALQLMMHAGCS
eukprot:TRINITY_DN4746_c0_g1_i1.p1 TRINITY_DN4746_c0_g1~~TRINITY_DN4746_c0_g1_i1.p1  ORF type:complete len:975 (-),score=97.25 TRINITY_DN4746_c0_g1_i1:196-3120(-)